MFFFVFFAIGFLLSFLFAPKQKVEDARASNLSDFKFPRADEGAPVPRIYGTVKFKAPNTIWAGDFEAVPIKKKQKTGLFSSKKVIVGYKYYVGLDLAVCLGPNFVYRRVWAGKYELFNGCFFGGDCTNLTTVNRPEMFGGENKNGGFVGDIMLYCGDFDQDADPYLQSAIDTGDATDIIPNYGGTAHMVFRKCYFGNSPNIEPIYIEGSHFTNALELNESAIMPNGYDANPIEVLYHIYVTDWGNLDIDPALINVEQWRLVGHTVYTEGNGISLEIANPNNGGDITKEILRQVGASLFQNPSNGLFELVPLRNDYNIEDLPVFGPDQIKQINNFTKKLWEETSNTVRVKFCDRAQGYKENTVAIAQDFGNVRFQGRIKAVEIALPGVYEADLANTLAARELSQANVPLYQCELIMNRTGIVLAPGQAFVLNWPEYGIVQMVMRVRKFGLGTLKDGTLSIAVVQDEFALDSVVTAPPVGTPVTPPNTAPQEGDPALFELPYWLRVVSGFSLTAGTGYFAIVAKAPSNYSLGYNVVSDYPGETEPVQFLTMEAYGATAQLAEPLPQFGGFAEGVVSTLLIKNVTDTGLLTDTDEGGVRAGHGLFYLNGELLAFEDSSDEGDGTWELTNVRRALIDTGWVGGATNDELIMFDGQSGFIADAFGAGQPRATFRGKVQDVTTQGAYPLADLDTLEGVPGRADRPYPPDNLTVDTVRSTAVQNDIGDTVTVDWFERNKLTAPSLLKFEDDDTEAPEVGTLYKVQVQAEGGTIYDIDDDLAVTTCDITFTDDMVGLSVILVWAKLDGVLSYAPAAFPVTVLGGDTLTIDGSIVLVDDEEVDIT